MVLIIILYALFALSVSSSKVILNYSAPIFYTGARMFLAGLLLLGYQYYSHAKFHFQRKHLWLYAQIIFFGIYFTYIIRFWALNYMQASKTMFLFNLSPFFSAFYSYIFLDEKMNTKKWIGLTIGFLGIIPILKTTSPLEQMYGELYFISWPEFAVLASVASHSYSWIVMRKLVKDKSYPPAFINGLTMFVGGAAALLTSIPLEGFYPVTDLIPFAQLLLFIVLISNLICHNLYAYLLRTYTATFISFAGFMAPLFAAFYGWLFLHETITKEFYISSIIVFAGLLLFYQDELSTIKSTTVAIPNELDLENR